MIIGLTGGSGSGKSTVAEILKQHNMLIIDCDKIAHEIILKGNDAYIELINIFGENILDSSKQIDRKKLGNIVFKDKGKLNLLNECTHKHIVNKVKEIIKENLNNKDINSIVIDAPLLIEANLHTIVDEVWAVYADTDIRIQRLIKRDNITLEQAKERLQSQMSWVEMVTYADTIIYNNNLDDMKKQIESILKSAN